MIKVCEACQESYDARSGRQRKCPDCCKCKYCDTQLPNSSKRFCNHSCASKWSVENSDHLQRNLERARASENYGSARISKIAHKVKGVPRPSIRGANHPSYKGTRTERRTEMERTEYKVWRATIFKRDNYTCVVCNQPGPRIEAHHIYPWSSHVDLRYSVLNGVTLCHTCHSGVQPSNDKFIRRFTEYVSSARSVSLTPEELARFVPFLPNCSHCGKELRRKPCFRSKRWHFCDNGCRRAYEISINFEWRRHRDTAT